MCPSLFMSLRWKYIKCFTCTNSMGKWRNKKGLILAESTELRQLMLEIKIKIFSPWASILVGYKTGKSGIEERISSKVYAKWSKL